VKKLLWYCTLGVAAVALGGPAASRGAVVVALLIAGRYLWRKLWALSGRVTGVDE